MPSEPVDVGVPVMHVTLYDWVSSWTLSLFVGVLVACLGVVAVWVTSRPPKPSTATPVELVEMGGGYEDGAPDETLRVDSPEPETKDASPTEVSSDDPVEIAQAVDSVVQVTETATDQVQQQFDQAEQVSGTGIQNVGKVGSAKGTGRRPLGTGGGGTGGVAREQRWFVRFADRIPIPEYAKQLEFFGIELGALLPDGRLAYLAKPSASTPQVRYVKTGAGENRMYMTWQGGERRSADVQLFAQAGVEVRSDTVIFHFYSKNTENTLARLELDYRNRPAKQIRRTYFSVDPDGGGYKFSVYRQVYFQ